MRLFSLRYRDALMRKRLSVSIPDRLRRRIWLILREYDHGFSVQRNPADHWTDNTSVLTETERELQIAYGEKSLTARLNPSTDTRGPVKLEGFVVGAYPAQVLDVLEAAYRHLGEPGDEQLKSQINDAFEEEKCPWRLTDGAFFKVDSEFLAVQILERTQAMLKAEQFRGALDELMEARADLQAGDTKDAILKAGKSLESTLKSVLGRDKGNASDLIRAFVSSQYCDDLPPELRTPFGDAVLMSLPFLRNKLGGHGQGTDIVDVPKPYAALAIHLGGAFAQFILHQHLAKKPKAPPDPPDDDVPF